MYFFIFSKNLVRCSKILAKCNKVLTRSGLKKTGGKIHANARHLGRTRRVRAVPEGRLATKRPPSGDLLYVEHTTPFPPNETNSMDVHGAHEDLQ